MLNRMGFVKLALTEYMMRVVILICFFIQAISLNFPFQVRSETRISRFNVPHSFSNGGSKIPPIDNDFRLFGSNDESKDNITSSSSNELADFDESDNPIVRKWKSLSSDARDDIKSTVFALLFAFCLRAFIVEPRYIPSLSMFPTFDVGDQLLVDKISHVSRGYQRRDVVVFDPPQTYVDLTGNTEALIKRIVAVGGDTLEVKNRKVYVNGVAQKEEYIADDPEYSLPPVIVPEGYCLVLGDNRNRSFDSHIWGLLPEKNIIGRAVFKYWPPWRTGFVEGSM